MAYHFITIIVLDQFARFFMSNSSSLQANFVLPWVLRKEMQIQSKSHRHNDYVHLGEADTVS